MRNTSTDSQLKPRVHRSSKHLGASYKYTQKLFALPRSTAPLRDLQAADGNPPAPQHPAPAAPSILLSILQRGRDTMGRMQQCKEDSSQPG